MMCAGNNPFLSFINRFLSRKTLLWLMPFLAVMILVPGVIPVSSQDAREVLGPKDVDPETNPWAREPHPLTEIFHKADVDPAAGHLLYGLGWGYNLLYHNLTEEERTVYHNKLIRQGTSPLCDLFKKGNHRVMTLLNWHL